MSNSIFPMLTGEGWPVKKSPYFSTIVDEAVGGQEVRIPNYPYPLTQFELPINVADLTTGDMQSLEGFFEARGGPWDSFLYWDPTDNYTVANSIFAGHALPATGLNVIGTGDGVKTQFQLFRQRGSGTRPIFDVNGITASYAPPLTTPYVNVWVNGVSSSAWTINGSGLITFTAGYAPANGYVVAADFAYFYRVRFSEDMLNFDNFAEYLFSAESIKFRQVYA